MSIKTNLLQIKFQITDFVTVVAVFTGNIIMHDRFGKGEIINMEGTGADKKAEIKFEVGGIKKLLLRFAKLDIIG